MTWDASHDERVMHCLRVSSAQSSHPEHVFEFVVLVYFGLSQCEFDMPQERSSSHLIWSPSAQTLNYQIDH